jgi:hypothetical protein
MLTTPGWLPCDVDRAVCFGLLDKTVGLNVTLRCGRGALDLLVVEPCKEEINGVVSVELEAMIAIGREPAGEANGRRR